MILFVRFVALFTFEDAFGEHGGRSNMSLIYRPPLCWNVFPRYSFLILINRENKTLKTCCQDVFLDPLKMPDLSQ